MRMLDRILRDPQWSKLSNSLEQAINVDVTDSVKWFYEDNEQEDYNYRDDFPSIVPPWPECWLEARTPRFVKTTGVEIDRRITGIAAHVMAIPVKPELSEEYLKQDRLTQILGMLFGGRLATAPAYRQKLDEALDRGDVVKWICLYNIYYEYLDRDVSWASTSAWYLDRQGRPLEGVQSNDMTYTGNPKAEVVSGACLPFFFAISLMHCKNVFLQDEAPTPPAVIRKREKRGIKTYQFKTLLIKPMQKQVREAATSDHASEVRKALHIVRGHFKDYRDSDGGLFGKYHDVYWWDMHVRGDLATGIVEKNYVVQPPQD